MDISKLHPALRAALSAPGAAGLRGLAQEAPESLAIIVRYSSTVRLAQEQDAWRVERTYALIPGAAGRATRQQIERLSERDDVALIWLDQPVYAFLDTSVPKIGAPQAWERSGRGAGVSIAILDTGIDTDHPDFADRLADTADFTDQGVRDGHGHGTHVASTAAGSGKASKGQYVGVAPAATLLVAKVLRNDGTGMMSTVLAGIEWAVEQGAHIINLSLGGLGPCDGSDAISVTCNAAVDAGSIVCAAAGNEGPAARTIGSPGCATRVLTVGASDDDDRVAEFSSRGPTLDRRVKPDVLFPGVNIVAARARGTRMGQVVDDFYTSGSGTSMATPHAAGCCALVLEANPQLKPDEVKGLLQNAALDLDLDSNTQGAGRVDVLRAVQLARGEQPVPSPAPSPTPPLPSPTPSPQPVPAPPGGPAAPGCMTRVLETFGLRR